LKVVSEDITRNTVQKSVVIICQKRPNQNFLFGNLAQKLQVISKCYFEEKDFSQTEVLKQLYLQVSQSKLAVESAGLGSPDVDPSSSTIQNQNSNSAFFGISAKKAIRLLRHDTLRLLKLLLLEKRIIIYGSGTQKIGNVILAMLSLFPKLLDSQILAYNDDTSADFNDAISYEAKKSEVTSPVNDSNANNSINESSSVLPPSNNQSVSSDLDKKRSAPVTPHEFENATSMRENSNEFDKPAPKRQFKLTNLDKENQKVKFCSYGHPLGIFTHGNFVHPYTCLAQMQKLETTEKSRIGYLVGSSNDLMRMKWKSFGDVLINLEDNSMNIKSLVLAHQVQLTTADLRFIDKIVETCTKKNKEVDNNKNTEPGSKLTPSTTLDSLNSCDPIEWEGGDEWIRTQFATYINSFLAVSKYDFNPQLAGDFNTDFLHAWKSNTVNSKLWQNQEKESIDQIQPVHPCHLDILNPNEVSTAAEALNYTQKMLGQEISDAGLKIKYAFKSTSSGRKVEAAVTDISVKTNENLKASLEYSNQKLTETYSTLQESIKSGKLTEDVADYTSKAAENAIVSASVAAEVAGKTLGTAAETSKKWFSTASAGLAERLNHVNVSGFNSQRNSQMMNGEAKEDQEGLISNRDDSNDHKLEQELNQPSAAESIANFASNVGSSFGGLSKNWFGGAGSKNASGDNGI